MRSRCGLLRNSALLTLTLLVSSVTPTTFAAEPTNTPTAIEGRLQSLVGDLKKRLEITPAIVVTIVPSNALMMSVEAPDGADEAVPVEYRRELPQHAHRRRDRGGDCARARPRVDLHAPSVSADRRARQSDRDASSQPRESRARLREGVGTRWHEGRSRAIPGRRRLQHSPLLQGSHQTRQLARAKPLASQLIVKDLRDLPSLELLEECSHVHRSRLAHSSPLAERRSQPCVR